MSLRRHGTGRHLNHRRRAFPTPSLASCDGSANDGSKPLLRQAYAAREVEMKRSAGDRPAVVRHLLASGICPARRSRPDPTSSSSAGGCIEQSAASATPGRRWSAGMYGPELNKDTAGGNQEVIRGVITNGTPRMPGLQVHLQPRSDRGDRGLRRHAAARQSGRHRRRPSRARMQPPDRFAISRENRHEHMHEPSPGASLIAIAAALGATAFVPTWPMPTRS